jgi:hypothetical protein
LRLNVALQDYAKIQGHVHEGRLEGHRYEQERQISNVRGFFFKLVNLGYFRHILGLLSIDTESKN